MSNTYIEDLFTYLERFEQHQDQFDTEAFLQTYNGVYAVFQALRQQRDKAVELDNFFLDHVRKVPLNKSDLRLITTQLLISFFEAEADIDGQSNKSYLYCRSLREIKQDSPYFETHLVPLLFAEAALNFNLQLNTFFLNEFARYINRYGHRFDPDMKPEAFDHLSEPSKYLLLARRRLELGQDLMKDRASLEFHLQQVNAFNKLALKSRTHREHLAQWKYLKESNFWAKIAQWFGEFFGRIGGAFSSWKYFRLVTRQRNTAYVVYTLVILLSIFVIIFTPMKWSSHGQETLQQLNTHADSLQQRGGNK
jgi:hypothetical protein